jgi:hypothetical protein
MKTLTKTALLAIITFLLTTACTAGPSTPPPSGDGIDAGDVPNPGADAGPGGGGSVDAGVPALEPLSPTTIVYLRHLSTGYDQIMAYDLATNAQTVLSDLDGVTNVHALELAPDRLHVAFAGVFRPDASELTAGAPFSDGLWLMTVDGASFTRLTPPDLGTHPGPDFSTEIHGIAWTADSGWLYYDMTATWMNGGTLEGGSQILMVPATGGVSSVVILDPSCTLFGSPSLSPDGTQLAFDRQLCETTSDEGPWVNVITGSPFATHLWTLWAAGEGGGVWLPDGRFATIIDGYWDVNGDGVVDTGLLGGVVIFDVASGAMTVPIPVHTSDLEWRFEGIALLADGNTLVTCEHPDAAHPGADLFAYDLTAHTVRQLTHDGASCSPSGRY